MAIKDSIITIKGDQAAVLKVEIMRDAAGVFKCQVYGMSKTADGKDIKLDVAITDLPANNATLLAVWTAALPILRTGNNLE
jgi:hypothetical protein